MLRKLAPPTGAAAAFDDDTLRVGRMRVKDRQVVSLLNWDDRPQTLSFRLAQPCRVTDFWTGADLGRHEGSFAGEDVPAHSARLLVCEPSAP
jgi:alpha-galactosidase